MVTLSRLLCSLLASCVLALGTGCSDDDGGPGSSQDAGGSEGDTRVTTGGNALLRGPWPQATGAPGADPERPLAATWRMARGGTPGNGFVTVPCREGCYGPCGIAWEVPSDRRIADAQVVVGAGDAIFVHVLEGPDAVAGSGPDGYASTVLRVSAAGDDLFAREPVPLDPLGVLAALAVDADEAVPLVRDMISLETEDGPALVVLMHIAWRAGGQWSVRDVIVGIDPAVEARRFLYGFPQEVFTQTTPFMPEWGAEAIRVDGLGRLVVLKKGRIEQQGRLYAAPLPRQGEGLAGAGLVAEVVEIPLEGTGAPYAIDAFEVDDRDRLWTVGRESVSPPLCTDDRRFEQLRLRVFAPDGALLEDRPDPAHTFVSVSRVHVERDRDNGALRAILLGSLPTDPTCIDLVLHYPKAADQFTDDEDDPTRCPRRFEQACTTGGDCPCRGCEGMLQICPPPLFGGAPPGLAEVWWYADDTDVAVLVASGKRATPVVAPGRVVTDGRGLAMLGGTRLQVIDMKADAGALMLLSAEEWHVESSPWADGMQSLASVAGGWQTPLFGAPVGGAVPFVAALRSTVTDESVSFENAGIIRHATEWGNLVTGTVAGHAGLTSRTVARRRGPFEDYYVAHGEVDRVYPLDGGRLLHVFHWAGPAAKKSGASGGANERRLELRIAVPGGGLWEGRDLQPAAGAPMPLVPPCVDGDPPETCRYPLGTTVVPEEVQTVAVHEVSCLLTDSAGAAQVGCSRDELVRQWEGSQAATLAQASSGKVRPLCLASGVRERRTTAEDGSVTLHVLCEAFTETLAPSHPTGLVSLVPRDHATTCDAWGEPLPLRTVGLASVIDVTITDASGAPVTSVEVGQAVTVVVTTTGSVHIEVLSGGATLNGGVEAHVGGGEPVLLVATAEGVVVLRVTVTDAWGMVVGTRLVAIAVEGPGACSGAADGSTFSVCHPLLEVDAPDGEDTYESLADPAVVREVLLHDRSLLHTAVDHRVEGFGPSVVLARTHRSGVLPAKGGIMGGWHLSLDMRLSPVAAPGDDSWLLSESDGSDGEVRVHDLALMDPTGRVDVWRHPGVSELVQFGGSGPDFWVWDPAALKVVARPFSARVVTFQAPRGRFAALRSYTLVLEPGVAAHQKHPYYRPDRGFHTAERRFYELVEPSGLRRIFDCKGRLALIIDPQHREVELLWEGPVHPLTHVRALSGMVDAAGRRWAVEWKDVAGIPRVWRVTDPFGRKVVYGYEALPDEGARLLTVTKDFGDGESTHYTYDEGRLTSVTRPGASEPWLRVEYAGGAVVRQVVGREAPQAPGVSDGGVTTFLAVGGGVRVTDGRGTARTYALEALPGGGPVVVASERWVREVATDGDPGPRLLPSRAPVEVARTFTHEASGLVASITHPSGRVESFVWSPGGRLAERREDPVSGGAARVEKWTWEAMDPGWPGFACEVETGSLSATGAKTSRVVAPLDPAMPGLACTAVASDLPPVTAASGAKVAVRVEDDLEVGGVLRGALKVRRLLQGGALHESTRVEHAVVATPTPAEVAAAPQGKVAMPALGHTVAIEVHRPRPPECPADTATDARTDIESDERGNPVRTVTSYTGAPCTAGAPCPAGVCEAGRCRTTLVIEKEVDGHDRVVRTVVDAGGAAHESRARYDSRGLPTERSVRVADDVQVGGPPFQWTPPRWVTTTVHYDLAGRRIASVVEAPGERSFELTALDAEGGVVATLVPGPGADDATVAAVVEAVRGGESPAEILAAWGPEALGPGNFASVAPHSGVLLDPRVVLRTTERDADGLPIRETVTDGQAGCAVCAAIHGHTTELWRDAEGRVVYEDPGRDDRAADGRRVLVETTRDGLGRPTERAVRDPLGCAGPDTVVRRELSLDYGAHDTPALTEIRGDDGRASVTAGSLDVVACDTGALLSRTEAERDARGDVVALVEHRFALLAQDQGAPGAQGARTTRFGRDAQGRVVEERATGEGLNRRERTAYGLQGGACWSAVGTGTDVTVETRAVVDEGGRAVTREVIHRGSSDEVTIGARFDHDAVGRLLRVADGLGQVQRELAWDSLGRLRAERDERGSVTETRWDMLGAAQETTRTLPGGERRTTLFAATQGYLRGEEAFGEGGGVTPLGERQTLYDALGRPAVVYPHGLGSPQTAEETLAWAGGAAWRRTSSGATITSEIDALGQPLEEVAQEPAKPQPGYAPAAVRTAVRSFRWDAVGHLTMARNLSTDDLPVSTVLRGHDSHGNLMREDLHLHLGAGGEQHTRTLATWDDGGALVSLVPEAGPASVLIEHQRDPLGRLVATRVAPTTGTAFAYAYPKAITYTWAGELLRKRVATLDSTFQPGEVPFTTTFEHDERGQTWRVVNAGPGGELWRQERLFWQGDAVVDVTASVKGGVPQADLAPIEALGRAGVARLLAPPTDLLEAQPSYQGWPDTALGSAVAVRALDGDGEPVRQTVTRWAKGYGNPMLSGTWTTRRGGRLAEEASLLWEPEKGKAMEARHLTVEAAPDGTDRAVGAAHRLVRKVAAPFAKPAPGGSAAAPTLAGHPTNRADHLAFEHGGPGVLAHDGCPGACADGNPRHRYGYDAWDQLVRIAADEPAACTAPGPAMDDVWPVATELVVVRDALGRRVAERWELPPGCATPESTLRGERDRTFHYLGDTEVGERIEQSTGDGVVTLLQGPEGLAWVAVAFPYDHDNQYVVLPDATGGHAGVWDVRNQGLAAPDSPSPWFRPHPMLAIDPAVSWSWRWLGGGLETQPFGAITWMQGREAAHDLRSNPLADRWYATLHATEGFWESVGEKALVALNLFAAAVGFVPFVGDLVGLLADAVSIGADFAADGMSWSLAGKGLLAVGLAAVGIGASLAGPEGWAAKGAARATISSARAGRAAALTADGIGAARALDAPGGAAQAARAAQGGAQSAIQASRAAEAAAAARLAQEQRTTHFLGRLFRGYVRSRGGLAGAPLPVAQRRLLNQDQWATRGFDACGPTALAMVLSDYGVRLTDGAQRLLSRVVGHGVVFGTPAEGLARGASAAGLRAVVREIHDQREAFEALRRATQRGVPVIAWERIFDQGYATRRLQQGRNVRGAHWIVVDQWVAETAHSPAGFWVRDPAISSRYGVLEPAFVPESEMRDLIGHQLIGLFR